MKSSLFLLLASLLVAVPLKAKADGNEELMLSPSYVKRVGLDLYELPSKPFNWDKDDWLIAGGVAGATGLAYIADDSIRTYYRTHRSGFLTSVSDVTTHFGDYRMEAPLIGSIWIGGIATGDKTMTKIAGDGAEASLIAAGLITPMLVYISGRALPSAGENAYKFEPFTFGRYSFPSGHTTEAFAMATVLDQDLRPVFGHWQTPIVYGMALGTAESRMYDAAHYLSDVVLGAGIGWSVGYWIANKPRNAHGTDIALIPSTNGAALAIKFN